VYLNDGDKQADYTIHVSLHLPIKQSALLGAVQRSPLCWAQQLPAPQATSCGWTPLSAGSTKTLKKSRKRAPVAASSHSALLAHRDMDAIKHTKDAQYPYTRALFPGLGLAHVFPNRLLQQNTAAPAIDARALWLCWLPRPPPRRAGQDKKVHHQGLPEEQRSCGNAQEGSYRIPALRVSCGVRLWVTYFKQPSWAPVEPVMLLAASSCLAPTNDADVAMSAAAITLMSQV
jgi:hypothetical protein